MSLRIYCPSCSHELPTDSTSCPSCGAVRDDVATQRIESHKSPTVKTSSHASIDNARFVPGAVLANRYRIVGLLGKGGMGEVYRADDLKLSQPVALKFLPDRFLSDGASLARFHREVRVARQVSHKNVCRVYDIGELDGHHFLSMEFIKGEELSSLLRRIGRLPAVKAIQIARQLCAGLAAAHENGVLHRDLKPSNIMIDGDGNARITDFGLAGLAEDFREDEMHAGTPAYMSPEQIEGKTVTVRSDIYSLGLVLYELFTGQRAYEAPTLGELMRLRRSDTTPTTPSEIVGDIDPLVERVIDRCLQKEPSRRPATALQVAAALPGGDPIAAALAAGETPSPEMVAAAPKEGALKPAVAVSLLLSLLVGLTLVVFFADKFLLYGYVPLEKSPEVLRERAREIIGRLGYPNPPIDYMHRFEQDSDPLEYIARTDSAPTRWQGLRDGQPAAIKFWYRQSSGYLDGFDPFRDAWTNPPPIVSGMAGVKLDTRGRLLSFYAVPPQIDVQSQNVVSSSESRVPSQPNTGTAGVSPAMSAAGANSSASSASEQSGSQLETQNAKLETILFTEAGLNISDFKSIPSQWSPPYVNDHRSAWEGVYPEQPNIPIRVEAASYRGKSVYFEVVNPWSKPERQEPAELPGAAKALLTLLLSIFVLVLIGSVLLAIRNLRVGRGDRKGAFRLALFVFTVTLLSRILSAHHIPTFAEFGTILNGLQDSLFAGMFFLILYLALEPFVRKRWPGRIISWARLLGGDYRDPLVGRDMLIGGLAGVGITLWQLFFHFLRSRLGDPGFKPVMEPANWNLGMGQFMDGLSNQLSNPLLSGFQVLFVVLLLALLFRRDWLAFVVGAALLASGLALLWGGSLFNWISAAVTATLVMLVLYRYGLLAMLAALLYLHLYINFPVTTHLTAWYATGFVIDLILLLALSFYAFHTSLAGQPLFAGKLLQED